MKKIMIICSLFLFAAVTHAQEAAKVELTKEKKAELKKMKEEHLTASFTDAGLTEEQIAQARATIEGAMQKSNELKADKTITGEEKELKKKAINEEKNSKLKEIMGDKFKPWNEIRKKQKAAEEAFASKAS
ncbi:MAG: hypothetical protein IPP72_02215 [Chitinophagaceae bacterium]|nr:hypothetical protein [Chitinophagaceae bacterium]